MKPKPGSGRERREAVQRAVVELDLDADVVERVLLLEVLRPALDPLDELVERAGHPGVHSSGISSGH